MHLTYNKEGKMLKKYINSMIKIIGATVLSTIFAATAFGAASTIPTGGTTAYSLAVGGVSVVNGVTGANGGGIGNRLLTGIGGSLILLVDPFEAEYFSGSHRITYPDQLLSFSQVVWYGEFSEDPSQPVPPPELDGIVNDTTFYPFLGSNPVLDVAVGGLPGTLDLSWSTNTPEGIVVETDNEGDHFNFVGIVFDNVSGEKLETILADNDNPANLFQLPLFQTLICQAETDQEPRACTGEVDNQFNIRTVPEPEIAALLGFSFIGLVLARRRRNS